VVVYHPHKRRGVERDAAQEAARAEPELLAAAEVARLLHCDVRTLRRLRLEGRAPTSIMVGKRPRWRRSDVEAWIATRKETR
jgi:excisionase family DNA binding protein